MSEQDELRAAQENLKRARARTHITIDSSPGKQSAIRVGDALPMRKGLCDPDEEGCGIEFDYVAIGPFLQTLCPDCHLKKFPDPTADQIMKAQRERNMRFNWDKLCPPKYRTIEEGGETDMNRVLKEHGAHFAKVMMWNRGASPRGLTINGTTGLCKTRIIWRLIRRIFEEGVIEDGTRRNARITAFDCSEFSDSCLAAFREGREAQWRANIAQSDVVLFDDLWKDAWTERVDAELFKLIEKLSSDRKPYFITSNWVGKTLKERASNPKSNMSIDRLIPLIRRIKEDCRSISFNEEIDSDNTQHQDV